MEKMYYQTFALSHKTSNKASTFPKKNGLPSWDTGTLAVKQKQI